MSFIPELIDQKDETTLPETDGHALRRLKIAEAIRGKINVQNRVLKKKAIKNLL